MSDLTAMRASCFCTKERKQDLWRLIPTWLHHHPTKPLNITSDRETYYEISKILQTLNDAEGVIVEIYSDELQPPNMDNVDSHGSYWNKEQMWKKVKAFERVLMMYKEPTLCIDADIVFAGSINSKFENVELVLSEHNYPKKSTVEINGESIKKVKYFGKYNGGMVLAKHSEVATKWLELYENNVGGFMEQKCLENLTSYFDFDVFSDKQNWGHWRELDDKKTAKSYHQRNYPHDLNDIQKVIWDNCEEAVNEAVEALTSSAN